jgi:hypothetical protein
MTEHCPDHHAVVETVGKIDGKVDMILTDLGQIKENISELFAKVNENDREWRDQKTRMSPVIWVIAIIMAAILTSAATSVMNRITFDRPSNVEKVIK